MDIVQHLAVLQNEGLAHLSADYNIHLKSADNKAYLVILLYYVILPDVS
jgi:hypothetical protein